MNARSVPTTTATLALVALSVLAPLAGAQDEDPTAADQQLTLNVDNAAGKGVRLELPAGKTRLMPEIEQAKIKADFTVGIPAPSGCVGGMISVTYALVNVPAGTVVAISPSVQTQHYSGDESVPGGPSYVATGSRQLDGFHTEATIMFQRSVPAFTDRVIRILVTASGGGGADSGCSAIDAQDLTIDIPIRADYMPNIQYSPEATLLTSGQNKKVAFPLTIHNYGNAPTRVVATLAQAADGLETVQPPGELFLDSKATSGENAENSARTAVTVLTSTDTGYTNKVHVFAITFRARSDTPGQDLQTQEITIPFSVKVQGVYVPGFDAPMGLAALGLALVGMAARRRRGSP